MMRYLEWLFPVRRYRRLRIEPSRASVAGAVAVGLAIWMAGALAGATFRAAIAFRSGTTLSGLWATAWLYVRDNWQHAFRDSPGGKWGVSLLVVLGISCVNALHMRRGQKAIAPAAKRRTWAYACLTFPPAMALWTVLMAADVPVLLWWPAARQSNLFVWVLLLGRVGCLAAFVVVATRQIHAAVEVFWDERICWECGYSLRGLVSRRCPECGTRAPRSDRAGRPSQGC